MRSCDVKMASTNLFNQAGREKTFYELLECDKTSSVEQIKAEFKVLALRYHPDKSGDEQSRETVLTVRDNVYTWACIKGAHYLELQRAYDILTDEQKRAQYDRWLDGGAIVPFDTWMNLQSTHSSLHWGVSPQQQPALLADSHQSNTAANQKEDSNGVDNHSLLTTFRAGSHGNSDSTLNSFRSYKL